MRPLFIAGNWKMNPATAKEAVALAEAIKNGVGPAADVRVAVCPPALFLDQVDAALANSPIGLGAQNMHWKPDGAYTGEISGAMLNDAGCTHVILGHSERRHGMGETDAQVNAKLHTALAVGLIPIVCIGETQQEREGGQTEDVVAGQLTGSLAGISAEQMVGIVLAYEPVWAIGTGLTATPAQAQGVHEFIRDWLTKLFGEATAARIVVQYGGSVKPDNAAELLACPDIDGALVGGASLKEADFLGIIRAAQVVAAKSQA
ncbi:triose-phosphate isomerase [Singulisphaera acidiphila]|uniref:Triosephosphate isomerase n=1 Tax=Singulisphaera acidiphila (strain ATCC BAA-1392 / DSM 18658 / VKM B-2454 / MOB10) TaxID=886293 RepID=L0D918_SINAD|nr:triose-phosphate isomerase [Singulisphaera acidiphila]AGA25869.1 triosephosphate isomerase [Singulisphaera acidiphila DSM 18658]